MAVERSTSYEQMSFEAYLALIEQDHEHAYEYLAGRVSMMTGGSPDHAIIGSNLNVLLLQTANAPTMNRGATAASFAQAV